jgi:regulator of protease activity HflC (stomatin/prohibitin superfamily)
MIQERERGGAPGLLALLIILAGFVVGIFLVITAAATENPFFGILGGLDLVVSFVMLFGLCIVNPNEAKVLVLFGRYIGSIKKDGWFWVNPFAVKNRLSMRVRNFETERLKVNDLDGNPIEIAAVVVWKVVDTAEASFEVDDYVHYVHVQSESALRQMATHYHYDTHDDENELSLRGSTDDVARKLGEEIQTRLGKAGVEVLEARISHLAYSPEIAEAMLRRQQAGAIIAARQKIVEGAVGMVEQALDELSRNNIVELDDERRATMVSNLLVVLCSEHATQPVVNAGTLYS